VYLGSNPDDSIVLGDLDAAFWWYVDRDIHVTGSGSFTESANTGTLTFAVNLKSGWNSVVWRSVSGGVLVEDGPVPAGYEWTYH
jgi:hypothetical protein